MYCRNCGKEITDGAAFCLYCGAAQDGAGASPKPTVQPKKTNALSIVGLALAAASFLYNGYGLISIAGLVLSIIGLNECKKKNEDGNILAIIGICISSVTMIASIISIILSVTIFKNFAGWIERLIERLIEYLSGNNIPSSWKVTFPPFRF